MSTSRGSVADTAAISAARVTEPRCQDVYSVTSTPRKNAPSRLPLIGHGQRNEDQDGEQLGREPGIRPRSTNAAAATTRSRTRTRCRDRSLAPRAGSPQRTRAGTAVSSRPVGMSGRRRSSRHLFHQVTDRGYDYLLEEDLNRSSPGEGRVHVAPRLAQPADRQLQLIRWQAVRQPDAVCTSAERGVGRAGHDAHATPCRERDQIEARAALGSWPRGTAHRRAVARSTQAGGWP